MTTRRLRIINCWRTLHRSRWGSFEIGERRAVRFRDPDLTVILQKSGRATWTLQTRGGIPVEKLIDLPTAPVVRRDETATLTEDGIVLATHPTGDGRPATAT